MCHLCLGVLQLLWLICIILLYILFPATSADRVYRIDKAQVGFKLYLKVISERKKMILASCIMCSCNLFMCTCRSIFTSWLKFVMMRCSSCTTRPQRWAGYPECRMLLWNPAPGDNPPRHLSFHFIILVSVFCASLWNVFTNNLCSYFLMAAFPSPQRNKVLCKHQPFFEIVVERW